MAGGVEQYLTTASEALCRAALALMERVEGGEQISVKDVKELTASLRELMTAREALHDEPDRPTQLTVVFEGEAEAWSR